MGFKIGKAIGNAALKIGAKVVGKAVGKAVSGALGNVLGGALGSAIGGALGGILGGGKFSMSNMVRMLKKSLIEAEGAVTKSDFYLTNIETDEKVTLCMIPEEVRVRTESNFRSFNIVERGEVKFPKGENLMQISWQGILPGARILYYPFVTHKEWEQPKEIIKVFQRWRDENAKLKLLITQTPINMDVYIRSFDYTMSGGQGHYKYSIELIAAKELKVMTVAEADAAKDQAKKDSDEALKQRAANKSKLGQQIEKINSLWEVAKVLTGNGGKWGAVASTFGITNPVANFVGKTVANKIFKRKRSKR